MDVPLLQPAKTSNRDTTTVKMELGNEITGATSQEL
jgi:hypothetical protein